jgi:hypothetical protein
MKTGDVPRRGAFPKGTPSVRQKRPGVRIPPPLLSPDSYRDQTDLKPRIRKGFEVFVSKPPLKSDLDSIKQ